MSHQKQRKRQTEQPVPLWESNMNCIHICSDNFSATCGHHIYPWNEGIYTRNKR